MDLWFIILVLVTIGLYMLPLAPGLIELAWPTDNAPLRVVQENDGDVRHFAHGFRRYLNTHFSQLINQNAHEGQLPDGTHYKIAPESGATYATGAEGVQNVRNMLVSRHPLTLQDGLFFESEIYSAQSLRTGKDSNFRALLANEDVYLGERSAVHRWVHTEKALHVATGCMLFGRASAEHLIVLAQECGFERLHAPRIEFGMAKQSGTEPQASRQHLIVVSELDHVKDRYERRWRVKGELNLPDNRFFDGDIVAGKGVRLGSGSHIKGSIKSNGDFHIGNNVTIEGSVVCTGDLYIGKGCRIKGPVTAENIIVIGAGTVIGSPETPTSVIAPAVYVDGGCVVYGSVWASDEGLVTAPGEAEQRASA